MKTALAIVCILALVWTQVLAQAPRAGAARSAHACCSCNQSSCCTAKSLPESPPVSATPVSTNLNIQLLFAPAVLAWTLPAAPKYDSSEISFAPLTAAHAPLYQRICALLI